MRLHCSIVYDPYVMLLNLYTFEHTLIAGLLERNGFAPLSALVLL